MKNEKPEQAPEDPAPICNPQREEKQQAEHFKNFESLKIVEQAEERSHLNLLKHQAICNIQMEIIQVIVNFDSKVIEKMVQEFPDALISPRFEASRDNLKPYIANIPGLFDDFKIGHTVSEHRLNIKEKAEEIRNASNLIQVNSLINELKNFHQEFIDKIKVRMEVISTQMVEKIKKALEVPQIPEPVSLANLEQAELSELEKLERELAIEREKKFNQLQKFHSQEFTNKLKVQMEVISTQMVEKIKKALDVPQIPQPVSLTNLEHSELSELEQLKQEFAIERQKNQDLEKGIKTILSENTNLFADLLKDNPNLIEECLEENGKIIELKSELNSVSYTPKHIADSSGSEHHHAEYTTNITDPASLEKKIAGATEESD